MKTGLLTHTMLLASAANAGELLTLQELLRWRRQGLLPGSSRPKGPWQDKHWLYPPETEALVLALCRLRHRFRQHAAALTIALWVEGYPMPWPRVHQALHHMVEPLLRSSQSPKEDPLGRVLKGLERVFLARQGRKTTGYPFSRDRRWNHQQEHLASLLFVQTPADDGGRVTGALDEGTRSRFLVHVLISGYKHLQEPSGHRPEKSPWSLEASLWQVKRLVLEGAFSLDQLVQTGMSSTAAQLEQARADYHRCLRLWQCMAHALEQVGGSRVLSHEGFRLWHEAPWIQAWGLLVLVRMRALGCERLLEDLEQFFGQALELMPLLATSEQQ